MKPMDGKDQPFERVFWHGNATLKSANLEAKVDCRVLKRAESRNGDIVIECREISIQSALLFPSQDALSLTIPE